MQSEREQFNRAQTAMAKGQYDVARVLFRQILETQPKSANIHFQLGRLELSDGKAKRAKKHLLTARKLLPQEPSIWLSLMDAEIALKDRKGIGKLIRETKTAGLPISILKQLQIKVETGNKQGIANLAGVHKDDFEKARLAFVQGRADDAERLASKLLEKHPRSAPTHAIRAASLAQIGQLDLAREGYEKALQYDPEYFEARLQLGQLEMGCDNLNTAYDHLTKAQQMVQDSPYAHMSLGILQFKRNNPLGAIEHLADARKKLPDEARLLLYLSRAYMAVGHADQAHSAFEHAQKQTIREADAVLAIKTLQGLQKPDEAKKMAQDILAKSPDHYGAMTALLNINMSIGNFEDARTAIQKLAKDGKASSTHFLTYSRAGKVKEGDPIINTMETIFAETGEDKDAQRDLAFSLAKTYEDTGQYQRSFDFLRKGNNASREINPLMQNSVRPNFVLAKDTFERSLDLWGDTNTHRQSPPAGPKNIQVTGMPRSGTTLVEQIISSHSNVEAAGEVGAIIRQADKDLKLLDAKAAPMTAEGLHNFGKGLTEFYAQLFPDAKVVTDKGIMSNIYAGLLSHALPNSKMVVLRRDPRDNCLSMYKNMFKQGTHSYTNDLEELANQYLLFLETLEYWRAKAPGSFYEIHYEALIANPEAETRALIDYCGLEWEDGCLAFYDNSRTVKTLSAFQVRQPLYKSSVAAWKRYENELQPLIKILDKGGALEGY